MHARIGAARADRGRLDAEKTLERRLKRRLHGRLVGLHLPAAEIRAFVFNAERHHAAPRLRPLCIDFRVFGLFFQLFVKLFVV